MHATLITIYLLAVGTLLASAGMTLWERKARPDRRHVLGLWAGGYTMLALGCLAATARGHLPGICGAVLSNLVIMTGYLLILDGVTALEGRHHRKASALMLAITVGLWAIGGTRWQEVIWIYVSAVPIALICGATAWSVMRSDTLRDLRSRRVVMAAMGLHALFYGARAFALPALAALCGPSVVAMASTVTMYEGVLFSVVVPMALLALVREEAHERLLKLTLTDYLTGLGNRRWFFEQGERLMAASRRSLSLLAFDIDHFKTINDRHGHETGDEVLKVFAQLLRGVAGPDAVLARIGGEEFAVLLPGCTSHQATRVGQTVVHRFADTATLSRSGMAVRTTVSVGLAQGGQETDLANLLNVADRALYAAKALGRNRIELAAPGALAVA